MRLTDADIVFLKSNRTPKEKLVALGLMLGDPEAVSSSKSDAVDRITSRLSKDPDARAILFSREKVAARQSKPTTYTAVDEYLELVVSDPLTAPLVDRYPGDQLHLIKSAMEIAAKTRKAERMSDRIKSAMLTYMSKYPVEVVLQACKTYKHYEDQNRNERYLFGIIRGNFREYETDPDGWLSNYSPRTTGGDCGFL